MNPETEIAKILLKIKAVTFNPKKPYRFTSGILSPVYSDLRLLMSYPAERKRIVKLLKNLIEKNHKPDVLAGTATAGISWAAWLAREMNLPMVYVRGSAKEHGKKKQVEGLIKRGQKVVIVEDLISTAKSSIESARAVKKEGGRVLAIIAIFNYTMPLSSANLRRAKVKLHSLVTFPDVVTTAIKNAYMKKKEENLVLDWLKNPAEWGRSQGLE